MGRHKGAVPLWPCTGSLEHEWGEKADGAGGFRIEPTKRHRLLLQSAVYLSQIYLDVLLQIDPVLTLYGIVTFIDSLECRIHSNSRLFSQTDCLLKSRISCFHVSYMRAGIGLTTSPNI